MTVKTPKNLINSIKKRIFTKNGKRYYKSGKKVVGVPATISERQLILMIIKLLVRKRRRPNKQAKTTTAKSEPPKSFSSGFEEKRLDNIRLELQDAMKKKEKEEAEKKAKEEREKKAKEEAEKKPKEIETKRGNDVNISGLIEGDKIYTKEEMMDINERMNQIKKLDPKLYMALKGEYEKVLKHKEKAEADVNKLMSNLNKLDEEQRNLIAKNKFSVEHNQKLLEEIETRKHELDKANNYLYEMGSELRKMQDDINNKSKALHELTINNFWKEYDNVLDDKTKVNRGGDFKSLYDTYLREKKKIDKKAKITKDEVIKHGFDNLKNENDKYGKKIGEIDKQIKKDLLKKNDYVDLIGKVEEQLPPKYAENNEAVNEEEKEEHFEAVNEDVANNAIDDILQKYDDEKVEEIEEPLTSNSAIGKGKGKEEGLYTDDIDRIMKKYSSFLGTIANDEYDRIIKEVKPKSRGSIVMNTDNSDKAGKHWVALFWDARPNGSKSIEFFDSFASDPTPHQMQQIKKIVQRLNSDTYLKLKINKVKRQSVNSANCGYHAMQFLINRYRGKTFSDATGYDDKVKSAVAEGEKGIERFKKELNQSGGCESCFKYI